MKNFNNFDNFKNRFQIDSLSSVLHPEILSTIGWLTQSIIFNNIFKSNYLFNTSSHNIFCIPSFCLQPHIALSFPGRLDTRVDCTLQYSNSKYILKVWHGNLWLLPIFQGRNSKLVLLFIAIQDYSSESNTAK